MIFVAVVHKDEDSAYGISFPDAPGCFAAADTLDDVQRAASEALQLYFEDGPTPAPRSLEAVREAVAEDLADGAMLIATPFARLRRRVKRVNLSLDAGTLEAIDAAAKAKNLTRSAYLAEVALADIRAGA